MSQTTARLLPRLELGPEIESRVVSHDLNETFEVDGVQVTMVSANHCPGAVMLIFRYPDDTAMLHTGDMRWTPKMKLNPWLKKLAEQRSLEYLFLDTTYCHKRHLHPPQSKSIQYVVDMIARHIDDPECVFLFQTYSIGKEKILRRVAREFKSKVFVDDRRWETIRLCAKDTDPLYATSHLDGGDSTGSAGTEALVAEAMEDVYTKDPATKFQVVTWSKLGDTWPYFKPNFHFCQEFIDELGASGESSGQTATRAPTRVIGFVPTGWVVTKGQQFPAARVGGTEKQHVVCSTCAQNISVVL